LCTTVYGATHPGQERKGRLQANPYLTLKVEEEGRGTGPADKKGKGTSYKRKGFGWARNGRGGGEERKRMRWGTNGFAGGNRR